MFKPSKIYAGVLLAIGTVALTVPAMAQEQKLDKVEVTGSRIKRADSEGALPVTVIKREELEASGAVTVAEFVRNITFASAGNFRPQSGSSAQSFAGVSLRGLGSQRTLVLIDGRRVAKAPNVGDAADMNSIPMAAVERMEILTDGASAIYGSDAIGGVINIVLRKNFEGVQVMVGKTKTDITGGDRDEASALWGVTSDKGRILAGVSKSSRDIIFVRDYPWAYTKGASSFSNNFFAAADDGAGGFLPGGYLGKYAGTCDFPDKGFYVTTRCRFDFNKVAADEAATGTKSVFARGEYKIAEDWNAYFAASNTNNTSFGRYAPVPDYIFITNQAVLAANGVTNQPNGAFLAHRFAAGGNRDTYTDGNLTDIGAGVQGTLGAFEVDFGVRRTVSKLVETGRGFVVKDLATTAINNGSYDFADPFNANNLAAIGAFTTTTGRDSKFAQSEVYGSATVDLFKLPGGNSRLYVGAEHRTEDYADLYDSLSESGQVLGSSGSSAAGKRKVDAVTGELLLPIMPKLEASIAARYEKYSDYGSDFSPKASVRWQPLRSLTLRGSVGKGFAAPSLPILTQKPAYSADSVVDFRHCMADGSFTAAECQTESFQINGLVKGNDKLGSEKSTQFSVGGVWDATDAISVKVDYWNTKIDDVITALTAQTLVNRDAAGVALPPGLSVTRDPATGAILQVVRGYANEGTLKYSGVDSSIRFNYKFSNFGSFNHELSWSKVLKQETNGTDFNGTWGLPKDRLTLTNGWKLGAFDVAWNVNYIGKNGIGEFEPAVPSYTTHDLQGNWATPIKGSKLTVGVLNVANKQPELVGSPYDAKPFNYYLYDAYGRQIYVRYEQKF